MTGKRNISRRVVYLLDAAAYLLSDAAERAAATNYDTHGLASIVSRIEFEARVMRATTVHCSWQLTNTAANDEMWAGDCGILWVFTDAGTPQEHGVNFCPHCGRAVLVVEDA